MSAPPRDILRCLSKMERLVNEATSEDQRALRSCRGLITITLSK